jgi:SAM-dependent methyltransferase
MLTVDPSAALREMRRVLRAGGRAALAVWAPPEENPWATIPTSALVALGHAERPPADAPGMFALAAPGRLSEMLEDAGFVEVTVDSVELVRSYPGVREYIEETMDLSSPFAETYGRLDETAQAEVDRSVAELAQPYTGEDGSLRLPGRSLVASAEA